MPANSGKKLTFLTISYQLNYFDIPYSRKLIESIKDGRDYDLSFLALSTHSGTHIDAPAHFFANGKTVDQYNVDDFILPARVIDIDTPKAVTPEAIETVSFHPGEALLFKTENSTSGRCCSGIFSEHFIYMSPEAAEICVARGAALVGIDYITIEPYDSNAFRPTGSC